MLGITGILASLSLLMVLAYRGASVIVLAPLCLLLAVAADPATPLLAGYTQVFMPGVGRFIAQYFPLFLLGAVFGRVMEASGAARRIALFITELLGAERAVLAVVLTCTVLTGGGVSLFVVVFAVQPIADYLFRRADVPRRLIPAAIALGSFTFTMTALPGTVQLPNLIPMQWFGTTAFAAAGAGLVASVAMFGVGMLWLSRRVWSARMQGEGYGADPQGVETTASEATPLPATAAAFAPILCVIVANFVLSQYLLPKVDAGYLSETRFGATTLAKVLGTWSALLSMLLAIGLAIVLFGRSLKRVNEWLADGSRSCLLPVFNTATEYGYGTTIASLAGFSAIRDWLGSLSPGNPLVSEAVTVNILAGITGSASGGLSLALESMGRVYAEQAQSGLVDPELLHRVAAMSCGGLDSLPHNGALITLLMICRCTHRESYPDIAVLTVLIPLVATAMVVCYGAFA